MVEKRNVYVGHRYVPKVMGEWNKQETYEGLSIVTYKGASYTSKKRVPKGIEISNEEYWVVTGNYNAQIEEYRQQIKGYKEETTEQLEQMALNVKNFGAKGDGLTDDTQAINNAISNANSIGNKNVFIPKGVYLIKTFEEGQEDDVIHINGGIKMLSNITLDIHPEAVLKAIPNNYGAHSIISIRKVENVAIKGGVIQGDRYEHTGTTGEWGYGIALQQAKNILIEDIKITEMWGDGINIQVDGNKTNTPSRNVTMNRVICDNNRRQGMSIEGLINGVFNSCQFINTNGKAPQAGVDIEPWSTDNPVKNVSFRDCVMTGNVGQGFIAMGISVEDVLLDKCVITNNQSPEGDISLTRSNKITIRKVDTKVITISSTNIASVYDSQLTRLTLNNSNDIYIANSIIKTDRVDQDTLISIPTYTGAKGKNITIVNTKIEGAIQFKEMDLQATKTGIRAISGEKILIKDCEIKNVDVPVSNSAEEVVIESVKFKNCLKGLSTAGKNFSIIGCTFEGVPCFIAGKTIHNYTDTGSEIVKGNIIFKKPRKEADRLPNAVYNSTGVLTSTPTALIEEGNHFFENE